MNFNHPTVASSTLLQTSSPRAWISSASYIIFIHISENIMRLFFLLVALVVQPSLCQRHEPVRPVESNYRPNKVHQQPSYRQHRKGDHEEKTKGNFSESFREFGQDKDGTREQEDSFWQDERTSTAVATIFRRTKPRGLIHGVWKASQSTAIGFFVGMTCLITFPSTSLILAGLSFKPMILSTVFGALVGSSAVGIGIWNGLHHFCWGLIQTPKAIQSWWTGSVWNPDDGNWEIYNLLRHKHELLQQQEEQYLNTADTDSRNYYQLLEVPISATEAEIKRAYHQKAKKWHPDKNPGAKEAEMFLRLHTAYQTLSDDSQRKIYDEGGEQDGAVPMDPGVFFSVLYDSFSLKSYTGELALATWATQMLKLGIFANGNDDDPQRNLEKLIHLVADMQRKEQKRQVDVALHLRDSVEPYTSGQLSEAAFREWCHNQALLMMKQGMFHDQRILLVLGNALELSAHQFRVLSRPFGWPRGVFLWTRRFFDTLSNKLQFYRGMFWIVKYSFRYMETLKNDGFGADARLMQEDQILLVLLKRLWNYNVLDIQSTIDGSCWKLFRDSAASRHERILRARAVGILGEEFLKVAKDDGWSANFTKEEHLLLTESLVRVEVALVMAQDKVSHSSRIRRNKLLYLTTLTLYSTTLHSMM
jgi:hypothetical protein